ncbi:MAG: hypothetical protein B7Z72_00975 [Gemmatimonadetes bacterium 21-71-4]|nr:MAG: hypothetical protein B7Z72_00975 [Gemmatimonadetes bacterium 21-71-4]
MDRGDNLYPISPDLSMQDQAKIHVSLVTTGGITNDATGAENFGTVVSLAESYMKPGWLFAGTDDGNAWMTRNDGATWDKLNGRFPGLPEGAYVSRIASDLPTGGTDWVHVIREDPFNQNLLFVGTSRAAYASIDRGAHWTRFMSGMPTVPVYDLKIQPRDHDLIAATFGRGIWIVNVAPLEQTDAKVLASAAHLYKPVTAYEYGQGPAIGASANGQGQKVFEAPSPEYGATISYRLASAVHHPIRVIVTDVAGDTVDTLAGPGSAGLHTVTWNFQSTKRAPSPKLTPSELRDSIVQAQRTARVIDSLEKAGMDTAVINRLRTVVKSGNMFSLFGRGGGGGGRAGRGGETGFVARPAEGPVPGAPARGGRGGAAVDVMGAFPGGFRQISDLFGMRGRGGFGRGAGGNVVDSGDYMVSITVDGVTQKQILRVDRLSGGGAAGFEFGTGDRRNP